MANLGTVISTMESPTTREFSFVVSSPAVRRGQFVQLPSEEGSLIAVVNDLSRSNRYFERPESVSEYEKGATRGYMADFPAGEWEYVVAQCSILGAYQDGMSRVGYPPSPGTKVEEIDLAVLKRILNLDEAGLNIGKLLRHDLDAKLGMNKLLQKHLAILGISGSGKSVCTSVVIEELLARTAEQGRMAVVVFDVHGEYACFGDRQANPDFADRVIVVKAPEIRISSSELSASEIRRYSPEISGTAVRELEKIIVEKREAMRSGEAAYTLDELAQAAESAGLKANVKDALVAWLFDLARLKIGQDHLFGRAAFPKLKDVIAPGKLTVFDLSEITNDKVKQIIVDHFSRALFAGRRSGRVPPFVMVVEEAHNFAREKDKAHNALARGIIETIAREGRKFGASLCLVTQRPKHLSTTALSQCNSMIIFRITNPYDVDHIGQSNEAIDEGVQSQLTTLLVGECIVVGEATGRPVFVRVRNRRTKKTRTKAEDLAEQCREYEASSRELTDDDAKNFV